MRPNWRPIFSILATATLTVAAAPLPIRVYPAPRIRNVSREQGAPVVVDGALSEKCWQDAPAASGFTYFRRNDTVAVDTQFKFLYNDTFLYLAVVCPEPEIKRLSPQTCARDSKEVFRGETIELFIDPKHDHAHYYQIAFNAGGGLYDSEKMTKSWDGEITARAQLGDGQWTAEAALSWASIGVSPKPGLVLGTNVCRDRRLGDGSEWMHWARTPQGFHDPANFGHLVLSPTKSRLAQLEGELRKGRKQGAIVICGSADGASPYQTLTRNALRDTRAFLLDLRKLAGRPNADLTEERVAELAEKRRKLEERTKDAGRRNADAAEWMRLSTDATTLRNALRRLVAAAKLQALLDCI